MELPSNSLRGFSTTTTTERTTPSFLAFLDEASLAGNVSFVDDDLDRHEHLGNALTKKRKNERVLGEREGGGNKRKPVGLVINGIYTGYYIFLYKWPIVNG